MLYFHLPNLNTLYYIPKDVEITVETDLNLSSHVINWNESKLSKEFFIRKIIMVFLHY